MDATRADVEFTAEVCQIAIDEGATTINIPDTVGYTMPHEFTAYLARLYELVPDLRDVVLSVHCHDDLGLAVANSFAGLLAGARQVECAINGIGERAGQRVARGDRDAAAHAPGRRRAAHRRRHAGDRPDVAAGLAADRLPGAAQQGDRRPQRVRARVGHPPGRRAEGAHHLRDHGRDARVGLDANSIVLGKHSGRHALQQALSELGFELSRPGAEHRVQALQGDRRQEEARHRDGSGGARHRRAARGDRAATRSSGSTSRRPRGARRTRPSASARPTARRSTGSFTGDGPVDAIFRAINAATGADARLREFRVDAVTGGQDALGETSVVLEVGGVTGSGQGVSTDILEAAGRAYVRALSNAIRRAASPTEAEAAHAEAATEPSERRRRATRHGPAVAAEREPLAVAGREHPPARARGP